MKKINVLEVNNIDLPGRVFNGYNMIKDICSNEFSVKQAVIIKQSDNKDVIKILKTDEEMRLYEKLIAFEYSASIHNLISITGPLLKKLKEYKKADIIHFHMFHNTKLSIPSLIQISNEKKVIISLHDPWFFTGRCVHFYDCNKWRNGCKDCDNLKNLFQFNEDNCSNIWKIKQKTFHNSNIDFIVASKWMQKLYEESPIFSKEFNHVHFIPMGIDLTKYKDNNNKMQIRKKFNIKNDDIVLFFRSQNEFKGTEYIVQALQKLDIKKEITVITCDEKGLLDSLRDKYNIIELGNIDEKMVIDIMNASDIFLMPSKGESFGMMSVEAMACSRPVIIFDNTAMPSITFAPECGVLVRNRDSEDLMKKIEFLIENEEERIRRGKLGREYCEKYYSYSKYNNSLKELYLEVYKRKNKSIKYNTNIDNEMYNKYLSSVEEYIKTGIIDKNINYSLPEYIDIINKVNEKVCNEQKRKISFKSRIKNIIKYKKS